MESESPVQKLVKPDSLHIGVDIGGTLAKICVLAGEDIREKVLPGRDKSFDCRDP